MKRFAFVLDQQVGLRTQALNLQRVVSEDSEIEATFVPVRYELPLKGAIGMLSRIPRAFPDTVASTLRGVQEIRAGLGKAKRFDAILWSTWAAKSVPDLVAAAPSFLVMDMTPSQMEEMGAQYGYTRSRARFMGGWKRRATERIYGEATHLFPWNDWVGRSLQQDWSVPPRKVTSISPGVDTRLFHPDPSIKPKDGTVRALFVGGDFARKGGDLLLRWASERTNTRSVELHLVTRDTLPGDAENLPGVFVHRGLTNNSPQLVRLYQQCDLFVLPTRADCYSLVALEAMACGLPVVVSNLGGIPDIVVEGETGFLTAPDDYAVLSTRLASLVEDATLRQRMGEAARARACTHFDCFTGIRTILAAMKSVGHTKVF
ncbi:MAG: glycosyltransferase family 4 protein [Armatimonadota bacterium]